jgi:hypothetical protein
MSDLFLLSERQMARISPFFRIPPAVRIPTKTPTHSDLMAPGFPT